MKNENENGTKSWFKTKATALWAAATSLLVAGGLYSCGCRTVQTSAPLLLPAAVCAVIDKDPNAAAYVEVAAVAIENFATGKDLSAQALAKALAGVKVPGVKPYEAQAIWGVVTAAYQALGEQYVNAPDRADQLKAALSSIVAGMNNGLAACAPPKNPVTKSLLPTTTQADIDPPRLKALAESIRSHIDQHRSKK